MIAAGGRFGVQSTAGNGEMDVIENARDTIRRHGLVGAGERVLLACSGGADSTCLLHVMQALAPEGSWDLAVAHFNHRLRRDADRDEHFVRDLADSCGLPFYSGSRDVASYSRERGMNLEEAGRDLRYVFLEKTASDIGAARIATAHTMDDQAETFLMRLLRGSGRSGLSGIPVKREGGRIVRPLIGVARAGVEAFLAAHAHAYRTDPSNRDRRYLRNRIRLELLPYLRDRFDPGIIPRLGRLVDVLQAEEAWLESGVDSASEGAILADRDSVRLDMNALSPLPLALRRRLVRRFLFRLRGNLRRISFEDIETILALEEGKDFTLERGLVLRRERSLVGVRPDPVPRIRYRYSWDPAAPLHIPELGLILSAEVLPASRLGSVEGDDRGEARLDAGRLRLPLTVRSRLDGDRYRPLGAPGRAKLKEVFRARGVSPDDRDRHPVFVSGESIVWVLGLPVSEDFKVSEVTSRVLELRVG